MVAHGPDGHAESSGKVRRTRGSLELGQQSGARPAHQACQGVGLRSAGSTPQSGGPARRIDQGLWPPPVKMGGDAGTDEDRGDEQQAVLGLLMWNFCNSVVRVLTLRDAPCRRGDPEPHAAQILQARPQPAARRHSCGARHAARWIPSIPAPITLGIGAGRANALPSFRGPRYDDPRKLDSGVCVFLCASTPTTIMAHSRRRSGLGRPPGSGHRVSCGCRYQSNTMVGAVRGAVVPDLVVDW